MRRLLWLAVGVTCLAVLLAGCGGGSSGPGSNTQTKGSDISGKLKGVANPSSYEIVVDGRRTRVHPSANGSFSIPGVPPGNHTISLISGNGMSGCHANVVVRKGRPVSVGDVTPTLGGQIGGIVTKALANGSLDPVEGVEVIATPSAVWVKNGGTATRPIPVGGDDDIVIKSFTDKDGSYLMRAVPSGSYDVSVTVPGFDPQVTYVWVSAGQLVAANFTVYPAPEQGVGTVEGTVTGKGEGAITPLEGAVVTVTAGNGWVVPVPEPVAKKLARAHLEAGLAVPGSSGGGNSDPGRPWIEVKQFSTLTDHRGRYSLNVPIGTDSIECWLEGWDWQGDQIVVKKNETATKDFELTQGQTPPPEPRPLARR